jgi:hypothetical protein
MRFAFLLLVLSPLLATAGNAPAGAPCTNPNQCLSHTCSQKRCAPSTDYPAGIGGFCSTNGTCKSKNCVRSKCEPPKEEKTKTSSTKGGGSTRAAPDDEEEEEAEAPKAKEPEPLPQPTPCSEDLLATVYKSMNGSRAAQFHAHDECTHNTPEVLEQAKKLFLDGYGYNFAHTVSAVKEGTPEQLACAKKNYDKAKKGRFDIPNLCLQPSAVIACADDLSPSVFKDKDDAKDECKKRSPAVIAEAKKMYLEKYGDSFRNIADILEKARPDQVECLKRDYEFRTEGRAKYQGFAMQGVCERPPEVITCYFELFDNEMKEQRYDYRARDSAEAICRRTDEKDVESLALAKLLRKVGFTVEFTRLVNDMTSLAPQHRACLKKQALAGKLPEKGQDKERFDLPKACPRSMK